MITNLTGLPESVVKLVSGGSRAFGPREVSVTQLIRPPQVTWLESQHGDFITEDAADRIWAAYGTLMHLALERQGGDNALVEEKLALKIDDWTVYGTPDHFEDGVLSDYKFVSVWTVADGVKPDWVTQLNFYAQMLREHGFEVSKAQIVAFYRDWSKTRAKEHGYPQQQAGIHTVPLWEPSYARHMLEDALANHAAALLGSYRPCTGDERWHKADVWAVTKRGNKRAARLLPSEEEAWEWASANAKTPSPASWFDIALRPGEDTRCESYCRVSQFCSQYAEAQRERVPHVQASKAEADEQDLRE